MKLPALALAVLASGCVLHDEAPSTSVVTEESGGCNIWECGTNSPVVAALALHEINTNPAIYSPEGWHMVAFRQGAATYTPTVHAGKLTGANGSATISGQGLVGAFFVVQHGNAGPQFLIMITGVNSANQYWAQLPPAGSTQPLFESYRFWWAPTTDGWHATVGSRWTNVCDKASADLTGEGIPGEHLLLFEGDRIDPGPKRFTSTDSTIDTHWFNLGCAGHALAKLHLTGHTFAAALQGFRTTTPQRQTMLKMFAADYCGNGHPFTVAGQPLQWKDENGWMTYATPSAYFEARWTPEGAACIGRPRADENPSDAAFAEFRENGQTVYFDWLGSGDLCPVRPPDCSDIDPTHLNGYHVVSATPPP